MMGAFSEASNERLREAQVQTTAGLDNLRTAVAFAASQAREMETATEKLKAKTALVGDTANLLDAYFASIDTVLAEMDSIRSQLEVSQPGVKDQYDAAEVEQLFSTSYTTEIEREVLRAALCGTGLPVAQQTFAGNDVELF